MPVAGLLTGAGYALWRLRHRARPERSRYLKALSGGDAEAALLFGLVFASTKVELDSSLLRVGDTMPDFTLTDLRGRLVSSSSLEGRVVILNFGPPGAPLASVSCPCWTILHREESTALEA